MAQSLRAPSARASGVAGRSAVRPVQSLRLGGPRSLLAWRSGAKPLAQPAPRRRPAPRAPSARPLPCRRRRRRPRSPAEGATRVRVLCWCTRDASLLTRPRRRRRPRRERRWQRRRRRRRRRGQRRRGWRRAEPGAGCERVRPARASPRPLTLLSRSLDSFTPDFSRALTAATVPASALRAWLAAEARPFKFASP